MNRLLITVISVLLLTILAIGGCAAPAPAPKPAPAPAPTPAPAPAPAQPIELKFSFSLPPDSYNGKNYQVWADKIKERTGGKVDIKCYAASSLLKIPETFRGVRSGVADIGMYMPGIEGGLLTLNSYPELHFLGLGDYRKASAIVMQLEKSFPALSKEYADAGLKMYKPNIFPGYQLHTTKKAVKTPGDLSGMKIISTGGPLALAISKSGGAPLDIPVQEYYTSLEKGLADGIVTHPGLLVAFKIAELLPYHTIFGDAGATTRNSIFIFNLNSWNKLPPDAQKVISDLEPELQEMVSKGYDAEMKAFDDIAKKAGHTFINLTSSEIKIWADMYAAEHEEWVTKNEAAGKPAKALYAELKRLAGK